MFLSFFTDHHHLEFPTGSERLAAWFQQSHFTDKKTEVLRNLVTSPQDHKEPALQLGFSKTNLTALCPIFNCLLPGRSYLERASRVTSGGKFPGVQMVTGPLPGHMITGKANESVSLLFSICKMGIFPVLRELILISMQSLEEHRKCHTCISYYC